jgi:hypothetical protein
MEEQAMASINKQLYKAFALHHQYNPYSLEEMAMAVKKRRLFKPFVPINYKSNSNVGLFFIN